MRKYVKKYTFKGYKIKETSDGCFDIFKPSWDPNEPVFEELSSVEAAQEWVLSDIKSDDNKRIMKENAVRDYAKRFKLLTEYGFNTRLEEEGEEADPAADPNAAPPADPNVEMDPNAAADPAADPNAAPPADPNATVDPAADPNAVPMEGEEEYEDIEMEGDEDGLQPGDNVIDISQLTDGQDKANSDMEELKAKFDQLVQLNDKVTQTLDKMAQTAEMNNQEIQSVKSDLAQRVPTEIEKLKGRVTKSTPYEQTVEDYWKQRPGGDKYDIYPDGEGDQEKEYILRKSDIENINPQSVYGSFNQNLRNLVGF
jgi:hypothetical protein